jgi:hypothetical protein
VDVDRDDNRLKIDFLGYSVIKYGSGLKKRLDKLICKTISINAVHFPDRNISPTNSMFHWTLNLTEAFSIEVKIRTRHDQGTVKGPTM